MTENERLRHLRRDLLHISAEVFASRIGVTRSAITNIERGFRGITAQTLTSVCREFGVSPEWLRDGVGEPFPPRSREEEIAAFLAAAQNGPPDSIKMRLLSIMARLDEDDWEALARIAQKIAAENEPEN